MGNTLTQQSCFSWLKEKYVAESSWKNYVAKKGSPHKTVVPVLGAFFLLLCKFAHDMALLICPSACRLRRLAQNGPGARHFSCKFSHKRELVKLLLNSLLRGPCVILYIQVLNRRSCRDPFSEVLPWKILQVPCLRGACMKALVGGTWVLVSRSCKIRYSSRSFYDDLVRFFQGSWHEEELGNGLLQVLVRSSCGDDMLPGAFA